MAKNLIFGKLIFAFLHDSSLIIHDQKNFGQGFRHPCMLSSDKQQIY